MAQTDSSKGRWYIKKGEKVLGPFPNQLLSRYLILGRIELQTQVSQDQVHWSAIEAYSALVPDVVLNASTPAGAKVLMIARVREDERSAREKESQQPKEKEERRENEDQVIKLHRQLRDDVLKRYRSPSAKNPKLIAIITALFIVITALIITLKPDNQATQVDCNAAAVSGVNWSFCHKQGQNFAAMDLSSGIFNSSKLQAADFIRSRLSRSDFSYADLSQASMQQADLRQAKLIGANLQYANLRNADLSQADLSYAELQGAQLQGAKLNGAKFSNAIWVNGEQCLPGSIGACLLPSKKY